MLTSMLHVVCLLAPEDFSNQRTQTTGKRTLVIQINTLFINCELQYTIIIFIQGEHQQLFNTHSPLSTIYNKLYTRQQPYKKMFQFT
jgi:hypothetical protein